MTQVARSVRPDVLAFTGGFDPILALLGTVLLGAGITMRGVARR